jgi:hypothetical protein
MANLYKINQLTSHIHTNKQKKKKKKKKTKVARKHEEGAGTRSGYRIRRLSGRIHACAQKEWIF